jgi:hypothetical protein
MPDLEQRISVVGGAAAASEIKAVADATQEVGDASEKAGEKAKKGEGGFFSLSGIVGKVTAAASDMVAGFLGMDAVVRLVSGLVAQLEKVVQLQDKLAAGSVSLAGESKLLARQLKLDERGGMDVLTKLRIAGGMDARTASEFGIAADVAFGDQGGLMKDENFAMTKDLAAFAGSKGMDVEAAKQLMGFLKAAGKLGSADDAKKAVAQIAAAATASKAPSVGAFVGMISRGGTGMLQAGMGFEDVLSAAGQARQVDVNEERASETLRTLEQVATGAEPDFTKEIDRVAKSRGMDVKGLTTAQRLGISRDILGGVTDQASENRVRGMLSPERGQRLIAAFRGSNVQATSGIGAAAAGATVGDFESTVAQGQSEITFRTAQNQAAAEYESAQRGLRMVTIKNARDRAKAAHEAEQAMGRENSTLVSDEAYQERYVREMLLRKRNELSRQGYDTAAVDAAANAQTGQWDPRYGYNDEWLAGMGAAIDETIEKGKGRRGGTTVVNVTNVGTMNAAYMPGTGTQQPADVNE